MTTEDYLEDNELPLPKEVVERQIKEHGQNENILTQGEQFARQGNKRTYKELSKRELLSIMSKENQRMKKKNTISKLIHKRLIYKKGKKGTKPTIVVKQRIKPEPYKSLYFNSHTMREPNTNRSLFFR